MAQDNKISVVINTYNAEKHLREVLDSVKDFDEIVICDMESKDNTLAIAREYGCKIVTFEKKNYTIVELPATLLYKVLLTHGYLLLMPMNLLPLNFDNISTNISLPPTVLKDSSFHVETVI